MTIQPYTDIAKVFQENYTFQYNMPYAGEQTVTFSVHCLGNLVLTSGAILVCDPLAGIEEGSPLTQTVPPGAYPVFVSVAKFSPRNEGRFACAMLRISEGEVARWENAAVEGQVLTQDSMYGYGVDTGLSCFLDIDTGKVIEEKLSSSSTKFDEYYAEINNALSNNATLDGFSSTTEWANMRVDDKTESNIIIFNSGHGDGAYPCFWGYDASDRLISLVTDFALFYETVGD